MNIEFFQNVFGTWKGYVYQYLGNLDGVTDISAHITNRYVELTGHSQVICSVVEVKPGMVVMYTEDLFSDNDEFKLYFDLLITTPEPVEPPPPEDTPPTE